MNRDQDSTVHRIKKYPNRRFYNGTQGRHVTLSELYELVREGDRIEVTDSKTGGDITNLVLAQIILEHDPPKMDLFPASLLHQAIQTNQHVVRQFIDRYFSRALDAFVNSRKQFDSFLQQAGLNLLRPPDPSDWARMMFGDSAPGARRTPPTVPESEPPPDRPADPVESLREELDALRTELGELRRRSSKKTTPRKSKAKKKASGKTRR